MKPSRRIAVFCGSSDAVDSTYLELARDLGTALASAEIGLVYGGGATGLMGAAARGAMASGGHVIGVLPEGLFSNGADDSLISELELVADMHERKARMYELSDGFIGLPGGMGTFEEVFEAATWSQLGLHTNAARKPVVLVDGNDYWKPIRELVDRAAAEHFMAPATRSIVSFTQSIAEAIAIITA